MYKLCCRTAAVEVMPLLPVAMNENEEVVATSEVWW
jgi:hypothetical protein